MGVDGGGTKTVVALFDECGKILRQYITSGSNHENLPGSYEEAVTCIYNCSKKLLLEENLTTFDIDGWSMGLSGADHPHQIEALKMEFNKLSIKNLCIYNDGYLPLLAGSSKGIGIAYNTGTGSCAVGIDDNNNMLQIGGLNDFSGDMGNGRWLISKAWQAVYDEIYLFGKKTALTQGFCELFQLSEKKKFSITADYLLDTNSSLFKNSISLFFKTLDSKDPVAIEIAETMAHRGALMINGVYKNLNYTSESLNIVLAGSIHVRAASQFYFEILIKELKKLLNINLNITVLDKEPVYGAFKYLNLIK